LLRSGSGRNAQGNEFGAWATVEVVDVHRLVNASVNIHCRCGDSVIVVVTEGSRQGFCGIDDTALSFKWFHN
jgi:hypothetical protein